MSETCTYILGLGPWPYTNPDRCGKPARYTVTNVAHPDEMGYACVEHKPNLPMSIAALVTTVKEINNE